MKAKLIYLLTAVTAIMISGCANYKLGTTLPSHLRTIYVATSVNQTTEPNIEGRVSSQVRNRFQRDGQLKVVQKGESDIILETTLLSYDLESVAYDRNNPRATRRYNAEIKCKVCAYETKTNKLIVETIVTGDSTFPATSDPMTARRNALNDVARDLAKEVVDSVVGAW